MTCLNDMCVIINESGPNDCNETIDCGQHTECQNEQCVVVDGDGDNECNDVFDCINSSSSRSMFSLSSEPPGSHTICQNNACIEVPGNGIDECDTVLGCSNEHTACLNNACVILSEPGANECSSVIQCDTHTECRNNQCIIVDGNGSNQCADVFDCLVSSSSRSSFAVSSSSSSAGTSRTSSRDSSSRVSSIARSSRRSIPYFHLACVSESCTYVEGDEPDSCRRGSDDCLPSSTSSQYTIIIALASSSESTKSPVIQIPSSSSQSSLTSSKEPLVAAASICGNGLLENREECDDSNRRDNDGCNSTCLLEIGICGDGVVQSLLGEQCEQSTHNATLPYTCSRCRFVSLYCGNGEIDAGEECDDGPQNSTSPDALCRPDCSLSRCGDGIIDSAEICDDGNRINNDGCDRYCRKESKDSKDPQHTLVASENPQTISQQYQFPQYPTYQQLPYQLPLAQLQPFVQNRAPIGDTGPAAVAVAASGMAAGIGWMRRKRK
ncbi:hypothetical protein COU76_01595 [Candidatus Peregrinibacteria bacterium CG10_big_fil_rev_8_21_14_0_10_49_10]|nr:MAG: hypothetical protein COU76_01595 [Candidatus Peregrinibacteria bacterium CG10_big_fil_rev_8_21_14_0_10_49_10]